MGASPGLGWETGGDLDYLRGLCAHWASEYDFDRVQRELGRLDNGAAAVCTSPTAGRRTGRTGCRCC